MQWISVTHVRRHHGFHGQASGHLYQGRYKSFCVRDDEHFLTVCRYVEANPLRARLVKRAQEWRWSSLHRRLRRIDEPPLSDWPVDRPAGWTGLVNEALAESELNGYGRASRGAGRSDRRVGAGNGLASGLAQTLRPAAARAGRSRRCPPASGGDEKRRITVIMGRDPL